jgi:hypothetical protein
MKKQLDRWGNDIPTIRITPLVLRRRIVLGDLRRLL